MLEPDEWPIQEIFNSGYRILLCNKMKREMISTLKKCSTH
jgi:hypothetical protein